MPPAGVQVVDGEHKIFGKLPLYADAHLSHGRSLDTAIQGANRLGNAIDEQLADGGNDGVEIGRVENELLLADTVAAEGIEREVFADAIVEQAGAGAKHCLGRLALGGQTPGEADARGDIAMVV